MRRAGCSSTSSAESPCRTSCAEGSIRAENLAFANEKVDVHVEYQRFASGTHWFHSAAIAGGTKPVGQAHMKLRVRD